MDNGFTLKQKSDNLLNTIIVATLIIAIFAACFDIITHYFIEDDTYSFTKGWEVSVDHNAFQSVDLDSFSFSRVSKRTHIELKSVIPDNIPKFSTIAFPLKLSAIDVYVNNQLVYSYGSDLFNEKKVVGSGIHYISLPTGSSGQNISVIIRPTITGAFNRLDGIKLVPSNEVYAYYIGNNILRFLISSFLFTFGFLLLFVSIILSFIRQRLIPLLEISILSITIGLWALTNSALIQVIQPNLYINTIVEYMALYTAPTFFLLFLLHDFHFEHRWQRDSIILSTASFIVFDITAFILHTTDVMHYPFLIHHFRILCVLLFICSLITLMKYVQKDNEVDLIRKFGVFILLVSGILDFSASLITMYILRINVVDNASLIPYGYFIFMIMLSISDNYQTYLNLSITMEKDAYARLAFTDQLTGLFNRTKADADFFVYEQSQKPYTVISLDLNGLKAVNDNYGHDMGDTLIRAFSDILKECFGKVGSIYRFGGDEFVVLMDDCYYPEIGFHITRMLTLEELTSKSFQFEIDTSFGVARSCELTDQYTAPSDVYKLADHRMYEMKIRNKKQRTI